ncbi:MAG TPA: hypothetical protein VNQ79_15190 [Blastocatellia bacterium]|nr:hypothetical protein [Blastocatellia bacterium]
MTGVSVSTHELLSRRVLMPLSHLKGKLRRRSRPVLQAYEEGMRFRAEAEAWSEERKSAWVLERLRFAVRRAYSETVYYQELFDQIGFDPWTEFSFDDYARLPVLERDDVQRAGERLISSAVARDDLLRDSTGGSTGVPTEIFLGPEERGWRESAGEYYRQRFGVPTGTRTALLWGHHLDPVARDGWHDRLYAFSTHTRWFDCFRLSPEVLARYHREFERWRPDCIIAYASALGHLAEYVAESGERPHYPGRCFITGAEKLMPHHRRLIESVFGRPVHERYGSRDAGYVAFQMNPAVTHDYETDWANVLLEPETGEPETAILITKLHADGMPMLRYRIGDVGRFATGSRPGYPVFTLPEVIGRDLDRVWLPDGRWLNSLQFPHLIKDFPVHEYMLIQHEDYAVELLIVPKRGFNADCHRQLLAAVQANLPGIPVNSLLVDEIPRTRSNKWRPVISEVRPLAERLA